jgi:glutamate formiminotransferase
MPSIVECVPNFSEGRDRSKVERIAGVIESVAGARVLDIHLDPDHNRSVITYAGAPPAVEEAAVLAVGEAASLIDLNQHRGEHPRIGATDVVPFVPLREASLSDCVAMAHRAGAEIWKRFRIPVYFYNAAALREDHRNLAAIRRGGFERLRETVSTDPARAPDVGDARLHPTAGATAVGAREALIAFNVNLDSSDVAVARSIARAVRASSGGLPAVMAMGVMMRSRAVRGRPGQAQISMNLTNWKQTDVKRAVEAVEREAARLGVGVESSEIVGLVPRGAIEAARPESLKLTGFSQDKILENRLAEMFP